MTAKVQHLVIDGQFLSRSADYLLADEAHLESFLLECVAALEMRILHGPLIKRGHIDLPGITGYVLIETSHLSLHTFTRTGDVRFDCYSCKAFDLRTILTLFRRYYPVEIQTVTPIVRLPVLTGSFQARHQEGA